MRPDWSSARNLLHVSMVGFALLIGRTPDSFIVVMCLSAMVFNFAVLPHLTSHHIEKPQEKALGFPLGLISYPVSLFMLSLIFYNQLTFMLIGWSMMAVGDGMASYVGRHLKAARKGSAPGKTWVGSAAFVFFALPMTYLLLMISPAEIRDLHTGREWFIILVITVLAAMLAERYEHFIDDNISVSFTGSIMAWLMHMLFTHAVPAWPEAWLTAAGVILVAATLAWAVKAVDFKGAIMGLMIAFCFWLGAGWPGLLMLFVFFVLGSAASRVGFRYKQSTGFNAFKSISRGWRNALANAGPAAVMGLLAWLMPQFRETFTVGMFAAMACATSDTLSSEIGTAFGARFLDVRTLKMSNPGPDGVISLLGLIAGLLGSAVIAAFSLAFWGNVEIAMTILFMGFIGNIIDTLLGAWPQRLNWMNNNSVNFASTLIAGALAMGFFFYR